MHRLKMSKEQVQRIIKKISFERNIRIMEVCGTHTMAIAKSGLKQILPENIQLISGPGCPVCVTDPGDLEMAMVLAQRPDTIIATFGDMLRVPGSNGSLKDLQNLGADIRVVYSALAAVELARTNLEKEIVFLAVGFETTVPTVAVCLERVLELGLTNFSILSWHKLITPAMELLLQDPDTKIDGFLCPGHVSSIIGTQPYQFIPQKYQRAAVVAGFEVNDLLESIMLIIEQMKTENYYVHNQYHRFVQEQGNPIAMAKMEKFFEPATVAWRGLGSIKASGLRLKPAFRQFDAQDKFYLDQSLLQLQPTDCCCGLILKGQIFPKDCPMFGTKCTPTSPVGPCMVSTEGACAANYYYLGDEKIGE